MSLAFDGAEMEILATLSVYRRRLDGGPLNYVVLCAVLERLKDQRGQERLAILEAVEKSLVLRENFLLLFQIRIERPYTHFVRAAQEDPVRSGKHIEVALADCILHLGLGQ